MTITIYHNPKCGTSRNVLAMIRDRGEEPQVIEYLKTPPSRDQLVDLLARMEITPRQLLRRKGTPYEELGLDDPSLTDAALNGQPAQVSRVLSGLRAEGEVIPALLGMVVSLAVCSALTWQWRWRRILGMAGLVLALGIALNLQPFLKMQLDPTRPLDAFTAGRSALWRQALAAPGAADTKKRPGGR